MNSVSTPLSLSPDSPPPVGHAAPRRVVALVASTTRMLFVLLMVAGTLAAPALAEPESEPGVTLSWPSLGLPPTISLNAPNSNQDFTVPVPAGLNPVRLRGQIQTPVNLGAGFLEISDPNGSFLGAVDLPPVSANQVVTPFDVDISTARLRGPAIGLSFTVRQVDGTGQICGPMQQLQLSDLSVDYVGVDAPPTTIANFFPPVLNRVTIYAPNDADVSEQQAVLTVGSAVVRLYAPQSVGVVVVNQPRGASPPPAPQLTRAVVVERGPAGLNVANAGTPEAHLRLSGRSDELTAQASFVVNELQSLAQVDAARVDEAGAAAVPTGDTVTFGQLNMRGRAEVIRTGDLRVSTDRAALGRGRVDSVGVHLLADYTPVAGQDAATVMVRANGVVVYTRALDHTGRLDATFDVPARALPQRINLDFALTYTPRQDCGPMIAPLTFQVDPQSTLTMTRGGPTPGGFDSVPSEFSPEFYVALDGSNPNQLSYAARVVTEITRLTTVPLTPRVVDVKAAAEATKSAVIVANANTVKQTSLSPPLSGTGSAVTVDLPTQLRAEMNRGLGSIQVFADAPRDRTVALVTTTDAWTLVDPLFDYIDRLDGGWSQLTGDVLAAGAAGVPVDVSIRGDGNESERAQPGERGHWLEITAAVALAGLATVAAIVLWRRRSRRLPSR